MRKILKHLISIIIAIIIVLLIQAFVITGSVVKDNTMSPNLKENDRIFVNKIQSTFDLLDNNDIIMYRNGDDIQYSRIIGKPGQSIAFKGGKLIRDDRQVDEPYTQNSIENLSLRDIKILKVISYHQMLILCSMINVRISMILGHWAILRKKILSVMLV